MSTAGDAFAPSIHHSCGQCLYIPDCLYQRLDQCIHVDYIFKLCIPTEAPRGQIDGHCIFKLVLLQHTYNEWSDKKMVDIILEIVCIYFSFSFSFSFRLLFKTKCGQMAISQVKRFMKMGVGFIKLLSLLNGGNCDECGAILPAAPKRGCGGEFHDNRKHQSIKTSHSEFWRDIS